MWSGSSWHTTAPDEASLSTLSSLEQREKASRAPISRSAVDSRIVTADFSLLFKVSSVFSPLPCITIAMTSHNIQDASHRCLSISLIFTHSILTNCFALFNAAKRLWQRYDISSVVLGAFPFLGALATPIAKTDRTNSPCICPRSNDSFTISSFVRCRLR